MSMYTVHISSDEGKVEHDPEYYLNVRLCFISMHTKVLRMDMEPNGSGKDQRFLNLLSNQALATHSA